VPTDESPLELSDEQIVDTVLAGNEDAFALLIARYKRRVFRFAARVAQDDDEQEDICQDIFIKAYEHLKAFRRDAPFEHWLTRIAVRCCYDALRSGKRRKNQLRIDEHPVQIVDQAEQRRHEAQQARNLLRWAMERLKPEERLVITLLELEEYSVREIAGLTGWSETNVKVRAHRARQALKRILEAHHETCDGTATGQTLCSGTQ
jgi:RNA polymerase sigma-70 factor (ECF subfamily)